MSRDDKEKLQALKERVDKRYKEFLNRQDDGKRKIVTGERVSVEELERKFNDYNVFEYPQDKNGVVDGAAILVRRSIPAAEVEQARQRQLERERQAATTQHTSIGTQCRLFCTAQVGTQTDEVNQFENSDLDRPAIEHPK